MGNDLCLQSKDSQNRQIRFGKLIFAHPLYNASTFVNDIAVIRLNNKFQETETFKPMPFATSKPSDDQICNLAGWLVKGIF